MKRYEIMYILDQDLKDVEPLKTKLNDILLRDGGVMEDFAEWGLRKFEYPINKKNKGYYFVLIVKTSFTNITEFKRISGIDTNVVRTFVLNTEKEENYEPSTKLSKTEVKTERFENKKGLNRRFERRNDYDNNRSNQQTTENKENVTTSSDKENSSEHNQNNSNTAIPASADSNQNK